MVRLVGEETDAVGIRRAVRRWMAAGGNSGERRVEVAFAGQEYNQEYGSR